MKSTQVLDLTRQAAAALKHGAEPADVFQEMISAGHDPADLLRVEGCLFAEGHYTLRESDEITTLLAAMSPRAAQRQRDLRAMERGLSSAFLDWIGEQQQ